LRLSYRYSLRRLELFWDVYMGMLKRDEIAPQGSQWCRDNQYSYSMFLTAEHNVDVHVQRLEHDGTLSARYKDDDELKGTGLDYEHVGVHDEVERYSYPSLLTFLPPDTFREIVDQPAPEVNDITVGFPLRVDYQKMQELIQVSSCEFCR
jgi:hypothetical protein